MLIDVLFAAKMVFQISKGYIHIGQTKLTTSFTYVTQFFIKSMLVAFLVIPSIPSSAFPNTVYEMLIHIAQHGSTFPFLHSLGGA